MKSLFLGILFIFITASLHSQVGKISEENLAALAEYEDTLGLVAYMIVNDSFPENRFAATKKMIPTLVKALKTENSFSYPFEQLRTVSIMYPPDSTFRVFTWQLYVDVNDYRYYGAIQMNTPELKLFPLIDRSGNIENEEMDVLPPNEWFGALYYNINQFDTPEGRKYLLFGYNGFSLFNKKKLVEVLSFSNGQASFGSPVFVKENSATGERETQNRIVKEYSSESTFRLNFDETYNLIMFDHLIMMGGSYGQGMTYVPDGTYEAYHLKNGEWVWVEKVFHEVMDEAPRPEPVLGGKKVDILGKEKQK